MTEKKIFDWKKIEKKARQAAAEGCVLLENTNGTLPIRKGERAAVFGRSMFNYYKSGTGSGGCVNVPYVTGILDALKKREAAGEIVLDGEVMGTYEEWLKDNPFDAGIGWAAEPWNQTEMPLDERLVAAAAGRDDIALIILGRTAGEDKDNRVAAGSYMLTETEEQMIKLVTLHFKRTVVILNTGNIIDMKWVKLYSPGAVLYAWQGGLAGGDGTVDVLMGDENPSGHLADTIAGYMADYPAASNFGDPDRTVYEEDIYIGYRYFQTFAPEKVIYPFGYGLSYTNFDISSLGTDTEGDSLNFRIRVENTGELTGQEAVQLYISKPQGKLGKPVRELAAFAKTGHIFPGAYEDLALSVPFSAFASYDDSGVTGFPYSYVAEAGEYSFYLGDNVRDAKYIYSINIGSDTCVEELTQALAPTMEFERYRPVTGDGSAFVIGREKAPVRKYDLGERIAAGRPVDRKCTGDRGYRLTDVFEGRTKLEDFLDQLADEELICMTRGEGMCSPKVTAGTASAFGGVTPALEAFGIPAGCCADGPSGIRMDCGTLAFAMPSGTLMACTFNLPLVEDLYELEGMDLRKNKVDLLLGPGINMHRHPLNGRNFEYFSEDPYLTGMMAAAQLKGMHKQGVSGTVKHFVGNEQEFRRNMLDSVISERALREIYLKPFEIAVKTGGAYSVMTSYGAVNGIWTAGNYDLVTEILRNEWHFTGMVMTDWWAQMNEEGEAPSMSNTVPMVRAQNDVYMVVSDSETNTAHDNSAEGLKEGRIIRGELLRNAANICNVLMSSPCMARLARGESEEWIDEGLPEGALEEISWSTSVRMDDEAYIDLNSVPTDKGCTDRIDVDFTRRGYFTITFEMSTAPGLSDLAQFPMSVYNGTGLLGTISINSTDGRVVEKSVGLACEVTLSANIKLKFGMSGIRLHGMHIKLDNEYTEK